MEWLRNGMELFIKMEKMEEEWKTKRKNKYKTERNMDELHVSG